MSEKFLFTEFQIESCCYGSSRGKKVSKDDLYTIFKSFDNWVSGVPHITHTKVIQDTVTYTIYVKEIASLKKDFVVTLWLSNSNKRNQNVFGLKVSDPPGASATVKHTNFGSDYIPGIPVYFFVSTGTHQMFTVRPAGAVVSGHPQFDAALRFFMLHHYDLFPKSKSVTPDGERLVVINNTDTAGNRLAPNFSSSRESKKAIRQKIESQVSDIRKIIHCMDLRTKSQEEKVGIAQGVMKYLNADITADEAKDTKRVKFEMDIEMTTEKLKTILDHQDRVGKTERIGFLLKKGTTPTWADDCISRAEHVLAVHSDTGVFSSMDILSAIEKIRSSVLK